MKDKRFENIRFAYFRDPEEPKRVLTVGYAERNGTIIYSCAVNKVVDKKDIRLDDRLRLFIGKELFNDIQKKYRKRFGGDQHCKNVARNVVTGSLVRGDWSGKLYLPPDMSVLKAVLHHMYAIQSTFGDKISRIINHAAMQAMKAEQEAEREAMKASV